MKEIITAIRVSLGMGGPGGKAKFARFLGVSGALVTLWEQGNRRPGFDLFVVLFNLASPEQKWELINAITDGDDTSTVVFPPSGPVRAVAAQGDNEKGDAPDPNPTA